MHLIVSSRRLKVKSMLQVSSPGATTPYPHDLYSLGKSNKLTTPVSASGRKNGRFTKKSLIKCNGLVEVQTVFNSPQQVSQQMRPNQRKSLSSRSSPNSTKSSYVHHEFLFQELQYSCAAAGDLFAGSKSTVTPCPSELPLPPVSWTLNISRKIVGSAVPAKDLTTSGMVHDSAIILSGPKLLA